jgi:tetratricopeptide (TPR) repeat protein
MKRLNTSIRRSCWIQITTSPGTFWVLPSQKKETSILYEEQGNLDKPIVEYDKAFSLDQNYGASYQLAAIYFRQNKYDLALGYIEKSLKKFNRSLYALNLQGLILDNLGRFSEAIESYKKALDIAPDETNIRFNLAYSYYHMNEFSKSKEILEKLLKEVKDSKALDQINALLKLIRERAAGA